MLTQEVKNTRFDQIWVYFRFWLERHSRTRRPFDVVDIFFLMIAVLSISIQILMISQISISYKEAYGFFEEYNFIFDLARWSTQLFGHNDYALRLPFVIVHFLNMILLYSISRVYLKKPTDSLFAVLLYAMLPGINFSGILVTKSGFIILITLWICYINLRYQKIPYLSLFLSIFIDSSSSVLFLAVAFYAIRNKMPKTIVYCLCGFALNMNLFDFDIGGRPQGHFLDILGEFAMLFSPFLFIYYNYTLYWAITKNQNNLMVYISVTALVFALLLSLRQNIDSEIFAPMIVAGLPIMVKSFFHDMRVRLPRFRTRYKMRFFVVFAVVFLETFCLFSNKLTYIFSAKNNFAIGYYIAKELSLAIKKYGITSIHTKDENLALRLRFYGIKDGKEYRLIKIPNGTKGDIGISYMGRNIRSYNIIKTGSKNL
ncbi:glycosyltransferase family 39 protein [Helicobacter cappadocius]|uniref:Glycosyltransferase family 39 protein n=1 Tax=Helicobacter cappadocius TaxID=3063998 RepID=A0AA90PI88_9HELI|nr:MULTISPECIES: glycosyltransferase family 39 protein [unclassified Helicobacter]MDO7252439.1 glycosyltransferase family 39 protein [Helicobacter sp. faydin-H75]MDP2538306.1 glycosyltransferase family 39 protein [Helicobacter sp. faydin-H76]